MDIFQHITSEKDLRTPYEQTRAGFIALSLEKTNRIRLLLKKQEH